MADELSPAAKAATLKSFVVKSPPGEALEVLKDVRGLAGADAFDAAAALRDFALKTSALVASDDGSRKIVISEETRVDETHFLDTAAMEVVEVDFAAMRVAAGGAARASAATHMDASLEAQRSALARAAREHAALAFAATGKPGAVNGGVEVVSRDGAVHLIFSGVLTNLANYWSAQWSSKWVVRFPAGPAAGTASLQGSARVHSHYFEDGNIQMQGSKAFEASEVRSTDATPEGLAAAVLAAIANEEDTLHTGLQDMYASMRDDAIKEIRRFLPVSGSKMSWNVHEHRMRRTLGTVPPVGSPGSPVSAMGGGGGGGGR